MLQIWQAISSNPSRPAWLVFLACLMLGSCVVPKKYPVNKPFVYETKINIEGKFSTSDRQDLQAKLVNQLDDSLKVRTVTKLLFTKQMIRPAVFDTGYAFRSMAFMDALLHSQGYMAPFVTWDSSIRVVEDQQRVYVTFIVTPGKNLKIDSIAFALRDTTLQRLSMRSRNRSLLKKGESYNLETIGGELDRLIGIYRDNGFFKISREDIYAEVDTVVAGLINPNLDPFEQIRLLEEVKKRRENPTVNITIKQRGKETPNSISQYHVRDVSIYPDLRPLEDSLLTGFDTTKINGITIFTKTDKFKKSFLIKNNYLIPGDLYRQRNYYRTVNNFGQLGAWQQVNVDVKPNDSLKLLDFTVKLYPAKRFGLSADLEASRNASDLYTSSNLFGLAINFGLSNRNLFKESVKTNTNLRFGIELGKNIVQTFQTILNHNITFPRFILPFKVKNEEDFLTRNTILNLNASNTLRRDFFTLNSLNASWAYQWIKRERIRGANAGAGAPPVVVVGSGNRKTLRHEWYYSPLNVELLRVIGTDSLQKLFDEIPNLENSFRSGLIISQNLVYKLLLTNKNKQSAFKVGFEESGGLFGLIKGLDENSGLYRYLRMDVDFRHFINYKKSSWALRIYGGMGIPYGKESTGEKETSLPYVRSFFAGGPSSMRAWQVRRLGPGSNKYFDTTGYDRFGDIQLESNIEYRFNLGTVWGIKLKSAFFSDIGNVWFKEKQEDPKLAGSEFDISRLYKDIAVGAGTSIRLDFSYFLIRLDYAYRIKNPVYSDINAGWFHDIRLLSGQLQLGINYPF